MRAILGGGIVVAFLAPLPATGVEAHPATPAVVDLHVDLSYRVNFEHGTLARGSGQYVASRLVASGVAGVVLPLFVPSRVSPTGPRMQDLEASYTRLLELIPRTPPYAPPGCRAADGSVRTWLAFEGAAPLAGEPGAVERWARQGVRFFGLVHTSDNALGTSSGKGGTPAGGLTPAGEDLVRRIHAEGGIVDVSHASDGTTDDVLRLARADGRPVVATHSDARALNPHPRNLTDEQVRGIARTGGLVGVNFHSRFLVPRGRARLADVVRHVLHLVAVGGADHVAIGSDFEGDISPPLELSDVRGFPRLATALEAAGMTHEDVAKVFGTNALRLLCPPGAGAPALEK